MASSLENASVPNATDTLSASGAKIATGAATAVSGFAAAKNLVLQLDVTVSSGTLPTLDVVVQDTVDGTNYNTIATFAQKVTTGREVVRVATPFTDTLKVSWTIGGTNPSFTFSVKSYADA
jgi:hypothetical protein